MKPLVNIAFFIAATTSLAAAQEHTPRPRPTPAPTPVASSRVSEPAGSWIRYESPEGRYSILMPAQPKLTTQQATSADGIPFTQYLANSTSPTAVTITSYFDQLPGSTFNFDNARDGMVKAINGTLQKESAISLGGASGLELLVLANLEGTDAIFRVRIYHVKTRIFVLQFISERWGEGPGRGGVGP